MIINYKDSYKQPIVLCLGFFDSIHIGHCKLINLAKKKSKELNCRMCIFTFKNNPLSLLNRDGKLIYTFDERVRKFQRLGVDDVIACECDKDMLLISKEEFEEYLIKNFNIKYIVVGTDYTYGYQCRGNSYKLRDFMSKFNIDVSIQDILTYNNIKISSTYIRSLLEQGDIVLANSLMFEPFSIFGEVVRGRGQGHLMGYPTINMEIDKKNEKIELKNGVYLTKTIVNSIQYKSITNIGSHPTYNDSYQNIETHIINFSDNLYGRIIEIQFFRFIRDTIKFKTKDELFNQLYLDSEFAQKFEY